MPARDRYHDQVKTALQRDGWMITHDPLKLKWGAKDMYVDLGAEQLLAAEKGMRKIAVEVKSFLCRVVFDALTEVIRLWIPELPTAT